jgi:hypothetical protein
VAYGDAARLYVMAQVDAKPYLLSAEDELFLF